jgi:hypothetical protein
MALIRSSPVRPERAQLVQAGRHAGEVGAFGDVGGLRGENRRRADIVVVTGKCCPVSVARSGGNRTEPLAPGGTRVPPL